CFGILTAALPASGFPRLGDRPGSRAGATPSRGALPPTGPLPELAPVRSLVDVHAAVVLGERPRETVGAVVPRDEVEEVRRRGIERGVESRLPRVRDAPRRETGA